MVNILEAIKRASPFFSFIVGLGISALLFHRNIASFRALAMPVRDVTNTIVKSDGKCWRYRVEDATCETSR
jgi:hypothetical protein